MLDVEKLKGKKVLLYSGGMDSYIINKLWKPDVKLYIDYGMDQNKLEIQHLPKDVIIKKFDLSDYVTDTRNTITLRNLILCSIAVNYGDTICLCGVKEDLHFDKTEEFATNTTNLFNSVLQRELTHRTVSVQVPFKKYTKEQLLEMYIENGNDLEELINESWSCYYPTKDNKECGDCTPCKRKAKAINYIKNKYNL